jgi:hypothetical protein
MGLIADADCNKILTRDVAPQYFCNACQRNFGLPKEFVSPQKLYR